MTADSSVSPDDVDSRSSSSIEDADPGPSVLPNALGRRRVLLVLAAGLIPWVIVPYEAGASIVFSFGLVRPEPFSVETVTRYVFVDTGALPPALLAWPTASLLYALAVASAASALLDREDRRVTAGLFALAGLDLLYFAVSFSAVRLRVVALPLGVVVLWLAAWESRPVGWLR